MCSKTPTMASALLTDFEQQRELRMAANRRKLEALKVMQHANDLETIAVIERRKQLKKPKAKQVTTVAIKKLPARRSRRLQGDEALEAEIDEKDRIVFHPAKAPTTKPKGNAKAIQHSVALDLDTEDTDAQADQGPAQIQARGSYYSEYGITCHFCRQKKLCGEPGCPRCSTRGEPNTEEECIGKTVCSRCLSHTGRFCRACLLVRYGQTMEDARKQMDAGTWLCPHCHEEDHPDDGWICNSSICMRNRGLAPTGLAITTAVAEGYVSVAHYVQGKLKREGRSAWPRCKPGKRK